MPQIDKIAPGNFCWIELATTDHPAAINFYTELFDWSFTEFPMAPDDFYTTFKIDGRDVGASYKERSDQRALGVPAHWNLYIAVDDSDASAGRAAALGAKIIAAPFDVNTIGRMAVLADPAGAPFCLWQAKGHAGFGIKGVPGTFCAADLSTPDQDGSSRFYEQLFGWRIQKEDEVSAHNYYHLFHHDEYIGGILPPAFRNPGAPAYWQVYLQVADCDATAAKAKALGANIYMPPMKVEDIGRMAVLADPQGAVFAIFEPAPR